MKNCFLPSAKTVLPAAALMLGLSCSLSAAASPALPSTSGALHVDGTVLLDSHNEPIQLKGISTHGLAWFPQYVNNDCFRQLREDFNANVVRLAMYTSEYGGYCNGGDQAALKQLIDDGVSYASENDLYVIIDWHILSDGNPNTHKDAAAAFFQEVSARYADAENVLYEICNEPNGGTTWAEIKSYAEDIIPVIRANDEDAIILVGTPNWSQFVDQAAADPITGYDNIMYTLHYYAATHTDSLRSTMTAAIESGLPIFVSEYGICDASGNGAIDQTQADLWIQTLDAYGVSYVAWNLSNKAETSAIFRTDCEKTSGFTLDDLSESGHWVYEMLHKDPAGEETEKAQIDLPPESTETQPAASAAESTDSEPTLADSAADASHTSGSFTYTAEVVNSWEANGNSFFQYAVSVQNPSDEPCSQWSIDLPFNGSISLSDGWNGDYTVQDSVLHITSKSYNGAIAAGGEVTDIGFILSGAADLALAD